MGLKTTFATVAFGAAALCAASANAGSITQPGETIGYNLGEALPQGLYFANTASWGDNRGAPGTLNTFVDIPVLAWSTPWNFLGGHIEAYAAAPFVIVGDDTNAMYNPFFTVGEAWNLGGGWHFANFVGAYAPVNNVLNQNFWTFNDRAHLTYDRDGWKFNTNVIFGLTGGDENTGKKISPDYVNVDVHLTKTIGKWTFGPVAFGSGDISGTDDPLYKKKEQFALGGLVGYDFPGISLGMYVTHDVYTKNYPTEETRVWTRAVVPLGMGGVDGPLK
jgi:hypothetical protein